MASKPQGPVKKLPGINDRPGGAAAPMPSALDHKTRQGSDRLSVDMTVEQKTAFVREALDQGLKANQYFWRMWEYYRVNVLERDARDLDAEQKQASRAAYDKAQARRRGSDGLV
ncbi:hypothetical protein IB275_30470 [Pseudomonas sp. PDM21]|uniref:hypothetical protein n=1 Tax=Pseudomonas sp. PDM21 TaxID=2769257 RepID=UPI00177B7D97|nr:hypothetical protein [Pseudomonas sp. PDM21]MBD9674941.1 hypothetical protein [Pseudomonas sp. PDM21]